MVINGAVVSVQNLKLRNHSKKEYSVSIVVYVIMNMNMQKMKISDFIILPIELFERDKVIGTSEVCIREYSITGIIHKGDGKAIVIFEGAHGNVCTSKSYEDVLIELFNQ